MSKKKIIY
jgi:hypothetical protein